jgi:hypothetical protein
MLQSRNFKSRRHGGRFTAILASEPATARSAADHAENPPALAGIGVDTWGVDFGLLGPDGALICNPICRPADGFCRGCGYRAQRKTD